jgi:hypothetical protein
MPTPEVERALALGAARSRAAVDRPDELARIHPRGRVLRDTDGQGHPLVAWFRALPPERRKVVIGIGLFLLFDLIAGLAAVTMGTHF